MIVRLTYCKFLPERIAEAKKIYQEEVIPVVRKQKGNIDVRLLEPDEKANDYISITAWETQADANAYHTSGVYRSLVDKLQGLFIKQPELKTYTSEEVMEKMS